MTAFEQQKARRPSNCLISLVVPCYCESENVANFIRQVNTDLEGEELEIIFVNDGSSDDTLERMIALSLEDNRIAIVDLSRNFGKEAALSAGIDFATGDVLIPLDVDLQDPPLVILEMIAKWREGYDVVNAVRCDRRSDTMAKRTTSHFFYRTFNKLADVELPPDVGDFRLLDRRVVEALKKMPERNRFMKGLFNWVGYSTTSVNYERPARIAGKTSFNYWKLWNFALDGVVGFSTLPLRIWTYVGSVVAFFALGYGLVIIVQTLLFGRSVPGYSSIMTAVLFFGGVHLISLGIIGEYIGRVFVEVKDRPVYVVKDVYGKKLESDND
ncbi:glycosyltransferase family 2 protein [uncultured Roseobacter sp.]|uniref:glycosyltransferase family 2 protein n=1 Tax=uncultured Roseobacter sp. TaxID=114847 RepID=UPI002639D16F|nr:glycosyltransferase family 2 protein [uncultured Roseobacter sp.]